MDDAAAVHGGAALKEQDAGVPVAELCCKHDRAYIRGRAGYLTRLALAFQEFWRNVVFQLITLPKSSKVRPGIRYGKMMRIQHDTMAF